MINGQKMFTTNAQEADYVFLLARTNPEVAKHKGLTTFLVPLRQPGVEIQPVFTLSGERTNLTFYSDVRVDDSLRIGEVDGGWDVMTVGLTFERSLPQGGDSVRLLRAMEQWALTSADDAGRPRSEDPDIQARLGRAARRERGQHPAGAPLRLGAELGDPPGRRRIHGQAVRDGGADQAIGRFRGHARARRAPRPRGIPRPSPAGSPSISYRFALGTTTYGGTSEVQRNIVAQRGLGLPRPS